MSMALLCRFCFFNCGSFDWSSHHLPHAEAAKTLVLAFVSIRLDYCNSLLYGIGDGLLKKLQIVGLRNSAARVVAVKTVNGPITSVLRKSRQLAPYPAANTLQAYPDHLHVSSRS